MLVSTPAQETAVLVPDVAAPVSEAAILVLFHAAARNKTRMGAPGRGAVPSLESQGPPLPWSGPGPPGALELHHGRVGFFTMNVLRGVVGDL